MSVYKDQLNYFVSQQDVKAKLLYDIGGAQHPLKGRTKSWDVEDYKIIDLEQPHVVLQMPDIAHDMNKPVGELPKADVIYCLGVTDYIINPNIFMDNIAQLLDKEGHAWIEWPLFYGHHEPVWDEGCRYSEGCIMRLLKQSNLQLAEMIRKPAGNEHLLKFMLGDGQRLSKNYKYHDTVGFITKVRHDKEVHLGTS